MRVDSLLPRAEELTLVLEAIGDDKVRINSASLTNRTYSFPVSGFHERAFAICSEGISETRLTSLNSVRPFAT
jgi:hypothetical protein